MASQKRIQRELAECMSTPPPGISVSLASESDLHKWHVQLQGPPQTPYAGGTFGLVLTLPVDYPFRAPTLTFSTRIWHPNVTNDATGGVCLSVLKSENWKPASKIAGVLESVRQLLIEPQPDDALEARIADEYKNDRKEFEKNVRDYVKRHAKGPPRFDGGGAAEPSTSARQ